MSKICLFCAFENEDSAVQCALCSEAIDNQDVASCGAPQVTLTNALNGSIVQVPENGGLVGRGCGIAPNVFNHKWVSETHCRISIKDNQCFVEDIGSNGEGSANGTYIDGNRLPKRMPTKFYNGSTLKIAHLLFDVKVEYPQIEQEEDVKEVAEELIWVIDCPACGKRFAVDGANSQKSECDRCKEFDIMDKKRIAKVKPKQVPKQAGTV